MSLTSRRSLGSHAAQKAPSKLKWPETGTEQVIPARFEQEAERIRTALEAVPILLEDYIRMKETDRDDGAPTVPEELLDRLACPPGPVSL